MEDSENVDFDFFDTPRENVHGSPVSPKKQLTPKPLPKGRKQHGEISTGKPHVESRQNKTTSKHSSKNGKGDRYYSDDSFSSDSDSDSETPRYQQAPVDNRNARNSDRPMKSTSENKYSEDYSLSESSSAYDYSSDDSFDGKRREPVKRDVIEVKMPKAQAWEPEISEVKREKYSEARQRSNYSDKRSPREHHSDYRKDRGSKSRKNRSSSDEDSNSDSSVERPIKYDSKNRRNDRVKSAKTKDRNSNSSSGRQTRKPLKSTSSSHSNNSDITDVSPLDSPENSPRAVKKRQTEKENGKYHDVQYKNPDSRDVDIMLDSDQLDLSILMKCMADIDREKQQRLKTNSRRVMFAPPTTSDKTKGNYTFSMGRAKIIEKENQRLLKQIMHHVTPSSNKLKATGSTRVPKKATEPVIQRLTPSAVNRQKEQRRIEAENMHMLKRLQKARPTRGMSRTEQINEFEQQSGYGVPTGTTIVPGSTGHYSTTHHRDTHSALSYTGSTQRSRPSSAKSNQSGTTGRRSRPSSAKSNASMRSNASVISNASRRSNASMRSNVSIRSGVRVVDGRADTRPVWDDRFSFS